MLEVGVAEIHETLRDFIALRRREVKHEQVLIGRSRCRAPLVKGQFQVPVNVGRSDELAIDPLVVSKSAVARPADSVDVKTHRFFNGCRRPRNAHRTRLWPPGHVRISRT